ncbi:hypothetical protein J437_LFUL006463 [Ladona fulva]|uniref:C2H2-type domain-containing protein n=1 Tax=Ladona fulva TaxID=123851 RepID=A0A8K0NYV1_LADFU|nr:hypothetical protein J437_LFUL006463 [Ladona fulva]
MYACRYCGQSMRLRQSLRRHLVGRHPEHREEWNIAGALDAMLTTLGDSSSATVKLGVSAPLASSLAVHSRTNFVDVAESAEILLTVAAGIHTIDGVEQVVTGLNSRADEDNSETMVGKMEPLVIGGTEATVCGTVGQDGVVVNDACFAEISSATEVIAEVPTDEVPLTGHTFILEDGSIIQQDGNNSADILLCVLGTDIQPADLNLE